MAVPNFLAGTINVDFNYLSHVGITDTITILNDLNTQLTALGWTCTVTGASPTAVGTYISPTRTDGVSFKVVATQVSATVLKYAVTDQWSGSVTPVANQPQQNIVATGGGSEARYYSNKFGFFLETLPSGVAECFGCGVLDATPEAINVPRAFYWATSGPRSAANALSQNGADNMTTLPLGSTTYAASYYNYCSYGPTQGLTLSRSTLGGSLLIVPFDIQGGMAPASYLYGRIFQCIMVDAAQSLGAQITVPIDTGVTAVFRVLGCATSTYNSFRIAARVS
jgi:hypothetical protein